MNYEQKQSQPGSMKLSKSKAPFCQVNGNVRLFNLFNFKWIVIVFIFAPAFTLTAKTELVTISTIKNVRINNLAIAVSRITIRPLSVFRIIHWYPRFIPDRTVSDYTIAKSLAWHKIVASINRSRVINFSIKAWSFAVVGYDKTIVKFNFIHDKVRSIANFHRAFRNVNLVSGFQERRYGQNNQSYILYKCKIYALVILGFISIGASIVSISLMLQPNLKAFLGFGFSAFVFAMIAQVASEKRIDLSLFGKPVTAYSTNETGFAFNMLMILIGVIIGLIVMYFLSQTN